MSNDYFKFRQFIVFHDKCSMKVNTDGVLLGAWADADNIRLALDIGTGSGLIALMIAQRSEAVIDAVEIDPPAALQACENAGRSSWKQRITVYPGRFQDFAAFSVKKYDLIVSNPPYFRNALKPADKRRSNARHDLSLTYEELLKGVASLLTPQGRLCVILPYLMLDDFAGMAFIYGLHCRRITAVKTKHGADFSRILLSFGPVPAGKPDRTELTIYKAEGSYSEDYRELTKDFYL
jgi:tRNA1Val (adenine37-N6)-methyltransferase